MAKINILTIGRNEEIASVVLRLIKSNPEWEGYLAMSDDEAITLFNTHSIELVLLGSGIEAASEKKLRDYFNSANPSIIILQHYGGGSGLLKNEIYEALYSKS